MADYGNNTIRAGMKPEGPTQHFETEKLNVQALSEQRIQS